MPVTMLDIARDLDVSVVTVSKALRNQGRISEATRQRVLRRAQELNYQPNWVAQSLVMRRTFTIGLLLPELTHSFFAEVSRAVAATARASGYHVVISCFEEDPALEASEVEAMLARQVDGLILATSQPSGNFCMFKQIEQRKVPYVLIDRPVAGSCASFIGVDNRAIGRQATAHLIEQGCRHIAHLRGPEVGIAEGRLAGYRQALTRADAIGLEHRVVNGGHTNETGYKGMQDLLKLVPKIDGVVCFNDPVAIGAMKAILEAGKKMPQDIAVVGAGNIHYSDVLAVPLTTVDQATCRIGVQAAELLLAGIASKEVMPAKQILIEPKLVARESSLRVHSERD